MGQYDWVVGVALNLVGSVMINLGTNLMKLSHNIDAKMDAVTRKSNTRNPRWLGAMMVFVVGNILNFSSFGFASQSMLAAMGSVQFISNVVFGHYILKEPLTKRVMIATGLILVGNTFCVSFAAHGTVSPDAEELMSYFIRMPFVVYICFVVSSVIGFSYLYREEEKKNREKASNIGHLLPFYYAAPSGIGCSLGVLCAKSISILLRLSFEGQNQLKNPFTYAIIIALVVLIVTWMKRLNLGLQKFDALLIIPMLQVFWTTFSIISGGIFFDEFSKMKAYESFLFFLGVVIVMTGVFSLAPRPDTQGSKDGIGLLEGNIKKKIRSQSSSSSIGAEFRLNYPSRASIEIPLTMLSGLPPTVEAAEILQEEIEENDDNDLELANMHTIQEIDETELQSPELAVKSMETNLNEQNDEGPASIVSSLFGRLSFRQHSFKSSFVRQVDEDEGSGVVEPGNGMTQQIEDAVTGTVAGAVSLTQPQRLSTAETVISLQEVQILASCEVGAAQESSSKAPSTHQTERDGYKPPEWTSFEKKEDF